MANYDDPFSTRPNVRLRATVALTGTQDIAENQSTLIVQLFAQETAQQPSFSGTPANNSWQIEVEGQEWDGNFTFDFRPGGDQSVTLLNTTHTVDHDDDGTLTVNISASSSSGVLGSANIGAQTLELPRIPRGPRAEVAGEWVNTIAHVEIDGEWQNALVYAEQAGVWKLVA